MKELRTLVLQKITVKCCQTQLSLFLGRQPETNHFRSLLIFSCVTRCVIQKGQLRPGGALGYFYWLFKKEIAAVPKADGDIIASWKAKGLPEAPPAGTRASTSRLKQIFLPDQSAMSKATPRAGRPKQPWKSRRGLVRRDLFFWKGTKSTWIIEMPLTSLVFSARQLYRKGGRGKQCL